MASEERTLHGTARRCADAIQRAEQAEAERDDAANMELAAREVAHCLSNDLAAALRERDALRGVADEAKSLLSHLKRNGVIVSDDMRTERLRGLLAVADAAREALEKER